MPVIVQNPLDVIISLDTEEDLSGKEVFALADALDGYEIESEVEERLVVDIIEISSAGIFAVHIIPKQMLTYMEIMNHIESMVKAALSREDIPATTYTIKKVMFRTREPGKPSETIGTIEELKEKVDKMWKGFKKDDMKSYA